MAEKASADRVAADMRPANFRAAIQIIRHAIQKHKDRIASENTKIGEQWGQVEGHKVNRKAGRIFAMLDKLDHEERTEIMRSLNGCIDAAGWDETAGDLVDNAEGNVVHLRVGGSADTGGAKEEGDDDGAGGDDGDGEKEMAEVEAAISEPAKPRRGRKPKSETGVIAETAVQKRIREARESTEKHFGRGQQPPTGEGYTGDNSDLAGEE